MDQAFIRASAVMADQHALITLRQFENLGGDRHTAARYVDRCIWERVDTGLYGPAGVPLHWRRRLLATVLVAPPGSLISHRPAATLQAVGGLTEPVPEISIPAGTRLRRPDVIVHESTDLHLADRRLVDGIPVTGPHRLAMDLGSVVSEARYRQTMREIRHGLGVSSDALLHTYVRHKRQGRNGGGALRDWLDRYYAISGAPESGLEQTVLDCILDAGLPAPTVQLWVEIGGVRYRIDFAYPDLMLAIEVDGAQHREDPDVVESDPVRLRRLRAAGWAVEVIRSDHMATDLARVLRVIRQLTDAFLDSQSSDE